MSVLTVRRVITAVTRPSPDSELGKTVSSREADRIIAEANKGRATANEKQLIRNFLTTRWFTTRAKAKLTAFAGKAKPADIKLGEIEPPGPRLAGKTFLLAPGQSLVFEAWGNQIQNMGTPIVPGLSVTAVQLTDLDGDGDKLKHRYTITVPANARSGTRFAAKSAPAFLSIGDPRYDFGFTIQVK